MPLTFLDALDSSNGLGIVECFHPSTSVQRMGLDALAFVGGIGRGTGTSCLEVLPRIHHHGMVLWGMYGRRPSDTCWPLPFHQLMGGPRCCGAMLRAISAKGFSSKARRSLGAVCPPWFAHEGVDVPAIRHGFGTAKRLVSMAHA